MTGARGPAPAVAEPPSRPLDGRARWEGGRSGWRRFRRHPAGLPSLLLLVGLGGLVLLAPWIDLHDPERQYAGQELWPPKAGFWFGTDDFGRDLLSRCLYGARLSLSTGLLAAGLAGTVGTALGMLAGFRRGLLDDLLGRLFDTVLAFPGLLTGLAVAVFLGKGLYNAAIAAAIINLPLIARLARAGVLSEREKEYTLAARAIGAPTGRIVNRHLLPNVLPVILVQVTLTIADAMIIEAGLSFLGLGAQPPQPSLGTMLRDSREFLSDGAWYAVFPGLILMAFLLLISFVSDALGHAFDPRERLGGTRP